MTRIHCVVGGQYGSEAKGHVAAQIATRWSTIGVRVGGPNAGHTVVDPHKEDAVAFRHIPVVALLDYEAPLFLAAGSEIDAKVLEDEVALCEERGVPVRNRLYIDRHATVIERSHRKIEETSHLDQTGSTKKGIGAARADRIWRTAKTVGMCENDMNFPGVVCETQDLLRQLAATTGRDILIEGTQGFGLGLHTDAYPFTTSGDCRAIDTLAQAGLIPGVDGDLTVWLVFRTYPIRIAGNSGPLKHETNWNELGDASGGYIKPELTTVTKKTRRVGVWDSDLAQRAVQANGGPGPHLAPCLMFIDYVQPDLAGVTDFDEMSRMLTPDTIEMISTAEDDTDRIAMFGTGPDTVVWTS